MATKVGEGYIEIKPRLVGFNRDLVRDVREKLRNLEDANLTVKPRMQGITKAWQAEVQAELKSKIDGLTVDVKVTLDQGFKATFEEFTIEAHQASNETRDAFQSGLFGFVDDLREEMRKAEVAIKTGVKAVDDPDVRQAIDNTGGAFRDLADDVETYSHRQISSIRSGVNEHVALTKTVERESKKQSEAWKANTADLEAEIKKTMRTIDLLQEDARSLLSIGNKQARGTSLTASLLGGLTSEGSKVIDSFLGDLGDKIGTSGDDAGKAFSSRLLSAIGTTVRFGVARIITTVATTLAAGGYIFLPLVNGISQVVAGLTALASSAAYAVGGALASLPALVAAIAQGAGVLGIALTGIQDALGALQAEQQHSALTAQTMAKAQETAARQAKNAKEALADAVRNANRSIADSESSLAKAQEDAAKRIQDSVQALADIKERANDRILQAQRKLSDALAETGVADAQDRLAQLLEDTADRIAQAEQRVTDATANAADRIVAAEEKLQNSHARTKAALDKLNEARKTAAERIENLRLAEARGTLDEAAAKLAIEQAKAKIESTYLDPHSSDLDKKDAEQAYEEAKQRLKEIQEKNGDLADEVAQANREGVEGSREVADAKQAIIDAQNDEIAAEKELAKTRADAARDISDADKDLAKARQDSAKQISAAEKSIAEARAKQVRDIADAEKDLADARSQSARDIGDAEKAIAEARKTANESIKAAESNLAQARIDASRNIARAQDGVKDALTAVAEAMDKLNAQAVNVDFAMSQLSPRAQEFVRYLSDSFIPKMREVQFSIQDAFFPPIQKALEDSGGLIELFKEKLSTTAKIFGDFGAGIIDWLNTPESKNTLGKIMDTNNRLFRLMGDAADYFGRVILTVAEAAGPFLERMGKLVVTFSKWLSGIVDSKQGRKELDDFFGSVGDTIETVVKIIADLGKALLNIFSIGQPAGQDLLELVAKNAEEFRKWTESTEGKNQLKEWFEKGKEVMAEVGRIAKDIFLWLWKIGTEVDFAAILKSVREDLLPAFKSFVEVLSGDKGENLIVLVKALAEAVYILAGTFITLSASWNLLSGDTEGLNEDFKMAMGLMVAQAELFGADVPKALGAAGTAYRNLAGLSTESASGIIGSMKGTNTAAQDTEKGHAAAWKKIEESSGKGATGVKKNTGDMAEKVKANTKDAAFDMVSKMEGAATGITNSSEDMRKQVADKYEKIRADAALKFNGIKDKGIGATGEMRVGIDGKLGETRKGFSDTLGLVEQDTRNRSGGFWLAARAMMDGLINGLNSMWGAVTKWFSNLGQNILDIFNRAVGNNSPSVKFKAAGAYIGEGLTIGIMGAKGKVTSATRDLAGAVTGVWNALDPSLMVSTGVDGLSPVQPSVGAGRGSQGRPGTTYNLTLQAVPTVPTERQMLNALAYADALYG